MTTKRSRSGVSLASIVSVVMLAAVFVFWNRGQTLHESVQLRWGEHGGITIQSLGGRLGISMQRATSPIEFNRLPASHPAIGFGSSRRSLDPFDEFRVLMDNTTHLHMWGGRNALLGVAPGAFGVVIPMWTIIPVTLLFPLRDARRSLVRRRRAESGLCITCGYDLRHSTERCPECGAPVPSPTTEDIPANPPKSPPAVTSHQ